MEMNPYESPQATTPAIPGKLRRIAGYLLFVPGLVLFCRISWIAITWTNFSEEETNRTRVLFVLSTAMLVAGSGFLFWSKRVARQNS